ncbi:MAG: hypothetical protein ACI81R_002789 [Bradymonadia bacterium]
MGRHLWWGESIDSTRFALSPPTDHAEHDMNLEIPAVFDRLPPGSTLLLAGCGGGYDIYCGIPLYLALVRRGHTVHLANLTFADNRIPGVERLTPSLTKVTHESTPKGEYHPEVHLAVWLHERQLCSDVYSFD